jgi:uncharacterized protein YyaL (SSP411 family)
MIDRIRKNERKVVLHSPATESLLRQSVLWAVDWYPWGEEAFAKARAEKKPIFLSVGYSTCHW